MTLLERERPLAQLAEAYDLALTESGRTVLLSGEAGIGKTSLIDTFLGSLPSEAAAFRGGCEALFAARPLGPLFDIADDLGGRLPGMLQADGDNHEIYAEFLRQMSDPAFSGAVFVVEDLHWADDATMDFIKFVGRRIRQYRCLLIASYRADEIGGNHPLNFVIGDLPAATTIRIGLAPLSLEAVANLGACDTHTAREILDVTSGNPFFVQELVSSEEPGVPRTVTEAILAKASRLSGDARAMLNLVSVTPGKCEIGILEEAFPEALSLLDECEQRGLLTVGNQFAAFRHELARLAIEDALPAGQRRKWNIHMLESLRGAGPESSARLAHHADMAGDRDAVLEHAPRAAEQAARLGAHREAATLYRQALDHTDAIDELRRARLLEALAFELYVTGRIEDAIVAHRQSLQLAESTGDAEHVARAHRWLSRLYWFAGKRDEAEQCAELALRASEELVNSGEYAMACSNRAQLYMLGSDVPAAVEWASKAVEIASENNDDETLCHALNNLGTALGTHAVEQGRPYQERSLELALANNFQEHAARAYTNLSSNSVSAKHYDEAATFLEAGIAYTTDRDLDSWLYYMQGWRARLRLETGDWQGAMDDATTVTRNYRGHTLVTSPAMTTIAQLKQRRGDADYDEALALALSTIADTNEIQRFAPLIAARAEHAWLLGDELDDPDQLLSTYNWARDLGLAWFTGELGWWLRQAGLSHEPGAGLPAPWELMLHRQDWAGAAAAWQAIGCPYEAALALAEGDEISQRRALEIFSGLGAEPAAAKLRKRLRERGVKGLPAQARPSTRNNPAGLTNRQLAVLRALMEGLSDADIAARLFISPRTVSHHVSAILGKLDVQSRTEAAAAALKLGIQTEK